MMTDQLSLWGPILFAGLAALIAWLLSQWYYEKQITEYKTLAKTKESDVYHLNEAHYLLKQGKEKKITDLESEIASKNSEIRRLRTEMERTEESNKSLLSQIVKTKKSKSDVTSSAAGKSSISALADDQKLSSPQEVQPITELKVGDIDQVKTLSAKDKKKKDASKKKAKSKDASSKKKSKKPIKNIKEKALKSKSENPAKSATKKNKSKIKFYKKRIAQLESDISGLKTKLEEVKVVEIVKEVPVTITKTVEVKEVIDRGKLKKFLKKLPVKQSKKLLFKDVVKGVPRPVGEEE